MAALIRELAVSGSRKADGTANASGRVFLYSPGTTTAAVGYTSDTLAEAHTTVSGGIALDAAGRVSIWINDPVDVVIQDSSGSTLRTLLGYNKVRAEQVEVEHASFTGALTDPVTGAVSQALGGKVFLQTLLTRMAASIGVDFKYLESSGATARLVSDFLRDVWISVKDFGALGNGINDDTAAIQTAVSRVKALGGGVVYFPPGTYKTSSAILASTGSGVTLRGVGRGVTIVAPTHATANAFTFTAMASSGIHEMSILHTLGSTGAAVAIGGASPNFKASGMYIPADATYVGFAYAMDFSGASDFDFIQNCHLNADTVALRENSTSSAKPQIILGCSIGASSAAPVSPTSGVEFNGGNGDYYVFGTRIIGATNNVLFNGALTGTTFRFYGNSIASVLGSTSFNLSGLATDPDLRQSGNGVDGTTTNVASGGTFTPARGAGPQQRCRVTSVGANIIVAPPTPTPATGAYDVYLELDFFNNGGADTTGWTVNAIYHLSAAPSVTNLEHTFYRLKWDPSDSVWRQQSREVST